MFGDLMGMMGKLKETQEKVKAVKARLDTVSLKETGGNGLLEVVITANREIREIQVDDQLLEDKEALQDYLVVTLNKAIRKATEIHETEVSAAAREGMPNIPGMEQFLKGV